MELNDKFYASLCKIDWFAHCGQKDSEATFTVQYVSSIAEALTLAVGPNWQDARTEAQGDLTGYLASVAPDAYYSHWNHLSRASRQRLQREIMPIVDEALTRLSAKALSDVILLDLNRIALYSAYSKRFRKMPDFFSKLLWCYERGHLPCGWSGDLTEWPVGMLIVF